ncbi:Peroxiredoxin [Pseudarcicella hirudinis]|uniref:Peroxiredoxin n=1 Tax=Pseudarcicella hirudinis TaxID=1079859 RepID=A0A1I5NMI6_9BACT|nr:TlpA disulfide reductase family protein [Pseudarcicella hirudinis]SFP22850.1 Peroxiredoxin [Pseudarcicella hirudinis]
MQNYCKFIALCLVGLLSQTAFSQKTKTADKDTTFSYYSKLAASAKEEDKTLLERKLYDLLKSEKEQDWLTAQQFFYQLKKNGISDSIAKADKIKFPKGQLVRNEEVRVVYDEPDAAKKEAAYLAWLKKFPPANFGTDRITYDYARNSLATAYAREGNVKKALEYANMVKTPVWKGEGWAGTANELAKKGYLAEAGILFQKALENSYKYMTTNKEDYGAQFAAIGYPGYCTSLADILYKEKKYEKALKYIRLAHDNSKGVRANINSTYADILIALGKDQEAFEMINETVKEGLATLDMKKNLKTLYAKVKGSNEGYEEYMESLNKILAAKVRKDLAKQIINVPAPQFTLKDLDGNTVSLKDFKGKTVVLDFWATWCGPCKKSFPAMKKAVEKFQADKDVKFLFVHTWEHGDKNASENARKFVSEKAYPFQVLMDLQDEKTGLNNVVDSFKVTGIPTKFVIDKEGNIRFKFTGFAGGDDAAVEEITAMIEMSEKK